MENSKQKNQYIQLFKFFACILITNSHCMYPETFLRIGGATSIFQIGGGWGNTLFFAISGFLVGCSSQRFTKWLIKRYRIIPITIIMCIICYFQIETNNNIFYYLISCFWFVTAIVIYYPILYIIDHLKNGYLLGLTLYCLFYFIFYFHNNTTVFFVEGEDFSLFKIYSFFSVIMVGGLMKKNINTVNKLKIKIWLIPLFFSLFIWVMIYGFMTILSCGYGFQFLVTISRILFGISAIGTACKLNEIKPLSLSQKGIINLIADSTLEIYLTQVTIFIYVNRLPNPINIICFWLISIVGGIILHFIYNNLIRLIYRKENNI